MNIIDYMDISEKHLYDYKSGNTVINGIKCSILFYKQGGFKNIISTNNIAEIKYMYLESLYLLKQLDSIMKYCDWNRILYPYIIGIKSISKNDIDDVTNALVQRGYRLIEYKSTYNIPQTEYLFLYRNRTEILDSIAKITSTDNVIVDCVEPQTL